MGVAEAHDLVEKSLGRRRRATVKKCEQWRQAAQAMHFESVRMKSELCRLRCSVADLTNARENYSVAQEDLKMWLELQRRGDKEPQKAQP